MSGAKEKRVIAVAGATACGKSALALQLAPRLNGEIVCMDSMQIYRRMDIGTAKPTPEERAQVPHHMLDIVEPDETYTVARYAEDARAVLDGIWARGHVPVLVGGTGLYLRALTEGLPLGGAQSDEAVRDKYRAIANEAGGKERLHELLGEVDAESARRLHPNDLRRVIRALEVYELTGEPLSRQSARSGGGGIEALIIGLTVPRPLLYERIEARVRSMMRRGLLGEVEALLSSGVSEEAQSMQGIGYKELIPVIRSGASVGDAAGRVIINTRHYSKRQGTFFRTVPDVKWLDATDGDTPEAAYNMAARFLEARYAKEKV